MKYSLARMNPILYLATKKWNLSWFDDRLKMPKGYKALTQGNRIFVLIYLKTGRVDVAYDSAYPEHTQESTDWKLRKGRELLAEKQVDNVVWKHMQDQGCGVSACVESLKEVLKLKVSDDGRNAASVGALKLKAVELILKLKGMSENPTSAPAPSLDDSVTDKMLAGLRDV